MEAPTAALTAQVLQCLTSIPKGKVTTYGAIAARLGNPHLARAVGNALHKNTDSRAYPCHRVVRADGRLSEAYAFGGLAAQAERLRAEGVEVANGRVDLTKYGLRGWESIPSRENL